MYVCMYVRIAIYVTTYFYRRIRSTCLHHCLSIPIQDILDDSNTSYEDLYDIASDGVAGRL